MEGESNGQVEKRTVSMYGEDWAEVDVLARSFGTSASAALRMIVREWRELRDPRAALRGEVVEEQV